MSKKGITLTLLAVFTISGIGIFFSLSKEEKKQVSAKQLVKSVSKNDEGFVSYQKPSPGKGLSSKQVHTKNKVIENNSRFTLKEQRDVQSRSLAEDQNRFSRPVNRFIQENDGKYSWSNDVFAIFPHGADRSSLDIVEETKDFLFVRSETKPKNAFTIIKDNETGKIGVYTGKVIIAERNRDLTSILDHYGVTWEFLSGTYILSVSTVNSAFEVIEKLKKEIPGINIDLDINFSQLRAN